MKKEKTNAQRLNEIHTNFLVLVRSAESDNLELYKGEKDRLESNRELLDILYYNVFYK